MKKFFIACLILCLCFANVFSADGAISLPEIYTTISNSHVTIPEEAIPNFKTIPIPKIAEEKNTPEKIIAEIDNNENKSFSEENNKNETDINPTENLDVANKVAETIGNEKFSLFAKIGLSHPGIFSSKINLSIEKILLPFEFGLNQNSCFSRTMFSYLNPYFKLNYKYKNFYSSFDAQYLAMIFDKENIARHRGEFGFSGGYKFPSNNLFVFADVHFVFTNKGGFVPFDLGVGYELENFKIDFLTGFVSRQVEKFLFVSHNTEKNIFEYSSEEQSWFFETNLIWKIKNIFDLKTRFEFLFGDNYTPMQFNTNLSLDKKIDKFNFGISWNAYWLSSHLFKIPHSVDFDFGIDITKKFNIGFEINEIALMCAGKGGAFSMCAKYKF